jgi:hypothetical protein
LIDYHDYIGDRVRVVDKDGKKTEGIIMSYDVGLEDDLDYDSIGIQPTGTTGHYIGIPIPDIVTFEVLKD